jgi:hypothetical protein
MTTPSQFARHRQGESVMAYQPADRPSDADMTAQLEKLPPGHPSSPWNADGTRRPPPPSLRDLELPLPGMWQDCPDD